MYFALLIELHLLFIHEMNYKKFQIHSEKTHGIDDIMESVYVSQAHIQLKHSNI